MSRDIVPLKKYQYTNVRYINNYDGDTIDFRITKEFDVGFGITSSCSLEVKIRLMGVDTYELRDPDADKKKLAHEGKNVVRELLLEAEENGDDIILMTYKDRKGKYGRYLAWVYIGEVNDENCLNEILKLRKLTTGKYEK